MESTSSIGQISKETKKCMQDKIQTREKPQTTPYIILSDSDSEPETKGVKEMKRENVKSRISYGAEDSARNKTTSNKKMGDGSPKAKGRKRGRPAGGTGRKSDECDDNNLGGNSRKDGGEADNQVQGRIQQEETDNVKRKTRAKKTKAIPSDFEEENDKLKEKARAKRAKENLSDSEEENEKPRAKKTKKISSLYEEENEKIKKKPRTKKTKLIYELYEEHLTSEIACHESKKNIATTEQLAKKEKSTESNQEDFVSELIDCIMEQITEPEAKPPPPKSSSLPLKFSFEDEEPEPVEKSEHDKMVDALFGEFEFVMAYCCEASPESEANTKKNFEDDSKTESGSDIYAHPCKKGKHSFYLDEEIGLLCRDCNYVKQEIRYIDPEFAPNVGKKSRRQTSVVPSFYILDFAPEQVNFEDPSNALNEGTVWDIIPGAKNKMYEHQQEGFEFLWKNLEGTVDLSELRNSNSSEIGGCIISHAPGTGKTLLTIFFIHTYLKLFPSSRPVITAPASMLLTWEEEFKKWNIDLPFHNVNNLEFSGKEHKKLLETVRSRGCLGKGMIRVVKIFSWSREKSVLGISYNLYKALVGGEYKNSKTTKKLLKENGDEQSEKIKKILLESPRLVVMDEGHTPRNHRSCIWNTLVKVQTKRKVILTGTPFQNNFKELFNTLRLVRPATAELLLKDKTFHDMSTKRGLYSRRQHKQMGACYSSSRDKAVEQAIVKLKAAIAPFVHVHKGTILQRKLPGLKDSVILLSPGPLQRDLIRAMGDPCCQSSFDYDHKLALISTHPSLFNHCGNIDKEHNPGMIQELEKKRLNYRHGAKTKFVIELVRLSINVHEKVLVFSQFIQVLKLIAEQLEDCFGWENGRHVIQMNGGQEQKYRQSVIAKFNDPYSEAMVLLASTKCCSEGINLIGASRVVLLDVVWNPSVERQAISRAYRLGQQKIVHTYRLMAAGTSEGDKYCRQVEKDRLSELVFSSTTKEDANIVKQQNPASTVNDIILQKMLDDDDLKDMFEKIIYQPKESNLIETFAMLPQQ